MRYTRFFLSFLVLYNAYTIRNMRLRRGTADMNVQELEITSDVALRYAKVMIRSVMINGMSADHEVAFQVRLPKEALITGFVVVKDNKTIKAEIRDKDKSQEQYKNAMDDSEAAGLISHKDKRDEYENMFQTKINVAANTKVEVQLQYEELLRRHSGRYTQALFTNSEHMIETLTINCRFKERQKFKSLSFKTPYNQPEVSYDEGVLNEQGYYVQSIYWPHHEKNTTGTGTDLPFEIEYELELDETGGMVFFNINGDFVHLFSVPCDESRVMTKQIVFVIDISGSMGLNPISQVRQAIVSILFQLRLNDYFNIIVFDYKAAMWKTKFQQANAENINAAKLFVQERVKASGSTNINNALFQAIDLFDNAEKRSGQIIVFLTDGSQTAGVADTRAIRENIRAKNYINGTQCCKSTLHAIAFGRNAALTFLRMIANENAGTLTIINEIEDNAADEELIAMYEGIQNPYYKHLAFSFEVDNMALPASNVTRTEFLQYDCGSEIVISGWTGPGERVTPDVRGVGVQEDIHFDSVPTVMIRNEEPVMLSRLVAYQWVKELLRKADTTTDAEVSSASNKKALELSLQYGFVTHLTSLVITEDHDALLDHEEYKNVSRDADNDAVNTSNCSTLKCNWSLYLTFGFLSHVICYIKAQCLCVT